METGLPSPSDSAAAGPLPDLSTLVITLLKGVVYKDDDERLWGSLLDLQVRVREHVSVMDLDLLLDEGEGYAFLRSRPDPTDDAGAPRKPRLVPRRPLSYPVSLLLALLRKKLAESDSGGGQAGDGNRLVLTRDEIVEMVRVFLPERSNEARLVDQIDSHINRIVELGFLRRLKATAGPPGLEVRRILKAFVDAQWLSDFEERLAAYRSGAFGGSKPSGTSDTSGPGGSLDPDGRPSERATGNE